VICHCNAFRGLIPLSYNDKANRDSKANVVASEIQDPGRSLPRAIKAAMVVVLGSYELVNIAYYILLPWSTMSSSDAVAVAAARSLFGAPAGIIVTILVGVSCAGAITSNVFAVGRLTIVASQHHYLPAFLSKRGLPKRNGKHLVNISNTTDAPESDGDVSDTNNTATAYSNFDAPMYVLKVQNRFGNR
jgi:L-type amino acid transporter 9